MADVGEECGLRSIELGQLLGPLALLLGGVGIGNDAGDLVGRGMKEALITLIKAPVWADAQDQYC
ncbi:MAG: hypothetical protein WBK23_12890 [Pseudomonas sp.]